MHVYSLKRVQCLPVALEEAWNFFCIPENLCRITPPEMQLQIVAGEATQPIAIGTTLEYTMKPIFNIRVKWTSEIKWLAAPHTFLEKQRRGPFRFWEHTHTFTVIPSGVKLMDEILYALPFGRLGRLAHFLFVRRRLVALFDYREQEVRRILSQGKP